MEVINLDANAPHLAMADNSSFLAFYGTQQGLWEGQTNLVKMQLENQEAIVQEELRSSGEKMTAGVTEAKVALDEEVQKLKKLLVVAKMQNTLYTNACKAFTDRGNNSRSLNTRQRGEREYNSNHLVDTDEPAEAYTNEDKRESLRKVSRG
jgi:hypothetical protein